MKHPSRVRREYDKRLIKLFEKKKKENTITKMKKKKKAILTFILELDFL